MTLAIRRAQTANPFGDIVRRAFNTIGRAHVQSGHKIIPVMMLDNSIVNMKVESKGDEHAILSHDGNTYGVIF